MGGRHRVRDYGIAIGALEPGKTNSIADVPGVTVGHATLDQGPIQTGVTALLPHQGNLFTDKVPAAVHVINGFGKSLGLVQIEELGNIETPVILTNTLSVGIAADALFHYMVEHNEGIGAGGTVNSVVCECNDGQLNDIRGFHITREHVFEAINGARADFDEGAVGAGRGMTCYGLKGGIGTASRTMNLGGRPYVLGAMVLANMGKARDLLIDRIPAGAIIAQAAGTDPSSPDQGSIIMVIGTDVPATERQLKRLAKRSTVGLIRTGSHLSSGSGDIGIAFSTANRVGHLDSEAFDRIERVNEDRLDLLFRAVAECVEESILNALIAADTTVGCDGNRRVSLRDYMDTILEHCSLR